MRVRRKYDDGVRIAYGVVIGDALEFEVPDHIAHLFKEFGYEVSNDSAGSDNDTEKGAKRSAKYRV